MVSDWLHSYKTGENAKPPTDQRQASDLSWWDMGTWRDLTEGLHLDISGDGRLIYNPEYKGFQVLRDISEKNY